MTNQKPENDDLGKQGFQAQKADASDVHQNNTPPEMPVIGIPGTVDSSYLAHLGDLTTAPNKRTSDVDMSKLSHTDRENVDIDDFYSRYKVWYLRQAKNLLEYDEAKYAILAILYPYFEMIAKHYGDYPETEQRKSKLSYSWERIEKGVGLVFKLDGSTESDTKKRIIKDSVRNGMAHISRTKTNEGEVIVDRGDKPADALELDTTSVKPQLRIRVNLFLEAIEKHFEEYVEKLRHPERSQENKRLREQFLIVFADPNSK